MLYLDYAKPVGNGYILNFFADKIEDIQEVSGGKEFVTKNGTNYGVPLASSTVVITYPDKSKKTFVLDDSGEWEETNELGKIYNVDYSTNLMPPLAASKTAGAIVSFLCMIQNQTLDEITDEYSSELPFGVYTDQAPDYYQAAHLSEDMTGIGLPTDPSDASTLGHRKMPNIETDNNLYLVRVYKKLTYLDLTQKSDPTFYNPPIEDIYYEFICQKIKGTHDSLLLPIGYTREDWAKDLASSAKTDEELKTKFPFGIAIIESDAYDYMTEMYLRKDYKIDKRFVVDLYPIVQ